MKQTDLFCDEPEMPSKTTTIYGKAAVCVLSELHNGKSLRLPELTNRIKLLIHENPRTIRIAIWLLSKTQFVVARGRRRSYQYSLTESGEKCSLNEAQLGQLVKETQIQAQRAARRVQSKTRPQKQDKKLATSAMIADAVSRLSLQELLDHVVPAIGSEKAAMVSAKIRQQYNL